MNNNYLESKPRYEILDGLRGVAAIFVVVFHLFVTYIPIFLWACCYAASASSSL